LPNNSIVTNDDFGKYCLSEYLMSNWYRLQHDELLLNLHVQPGAKCSDIIGLHGDSLKVKVAASPIEGRANSILIRYIADLFGVPMKNVEIKQGLQSRRKLISILHTKINPEILLLTKTSR
jgi:uncharacterized protein (TIGR00251 family)